MPNWFGPSMTIAFVNLYYFRALPMASNGVREAFGLSNGEFPQPKRRRDSLTHSNGPAISLLNDTKSDHARYTGLEETHPAHMKRAADHSAKNSRPFAELIEINCASYGVRKTGAQPVLLIRAKNMEGLGVTLHARARMLH